MEFDELEWLQNSMLHEASAAEEYVEEDHLDRFPSTDAGISAFQTSRKRPQPEPADSDIRLVSEKRIRSPIRVVDPSEDEDWLHYSPREKTFVVGSSGKIPHDDVMETDSSEVLTAHSFLNHEEDWPRRFASDIDGDFMPVTGPDGCRVYASLLVNDQRDCFSLRSNPTQEKGLLMEPIQTLLERIDQEAFLKACRASSGSVDEVACPFEASTHEKLWVDKYAPRSFTELLSDEKTNREVLCWLKEWDSCVFGSQIRATTDDVLSNLRRHSSIAHTNKPFHNKGFFPGRKGAHFGKDENFTESNGITKEIWNVKEKREGSDGSPLAKVLLLCGAPGLGKTTLAHVAAKHCGYRVVEINASDDRSAAAIEGKILDVVEMNSVTGSSKPKCLVIDEIDGALGEGKGAVDVILKMLAAEKKAVAATEAREPNAGKVSSKKETKAVKLLRPVICICNDLYAPALRPLRQVAKVHTFVRPTVARVVNRLKYICNREGFKTSSLALAVLAEHTECDIRACLNTLQFLYKKNEALNILDVGSQVIGRKDLSKSIFDIWKEIFQKRKVKGSRTALNKSSNMLGDFDHLHNLISNGGDYELTMDGIHENFLKLHYHDPVMEKSGKCIDILGTSDLLIERIMRTQQMSLYVYQPSIVIAIRNLVAQFDHPTIEWPKTYQRCRAVLMEKKETLKSWRSQIPPFISRHLSTESFMEDVISPLLEILSPPTLRPVAPHLLHESEKDDLCQLVDTMVSYSLNYKNVEHASVHAIGNNLITKVSSLTLDPPIGEFVSYKGYHNQHHGLPLAVRQVVVHEVDKERILRGSVGGSTEGTLDRREPKDIRHAMSTCEGGSTKPKNWPHREQLKTDTGINVLPASTKSSEAQPSISKNAANTKRPRGSADFFDRFRKSNNGSTPRDTSVQQSGTAERDSRPLLFKFNEGFTNAVKRPVRMRELLL